MLLTDIGLSWHKIQENYKQYSFINIYILEKMLLRK